MPMAQSLGSSGARQKCNSILYTKDVVLKCELGTPHEGHGHQCRREPTALSPRGIVVKWSDQDAIDSKYANVIKSKTPLIGWRCWKLEKKHNRYVCMSITAPVVWEGPTMRTLNNVPPHSDFLDGDRNSPTFSAYNRKNPRTDFGIFCYKTPMLLRTYLGYSYPIVGRISLTGIVIEHEYGYRAQTVTMDELWVCLPPWDTQLNENITTERIAIGLEDFYQCPVSVIAEENFYNWVRETTLRQERGEL